MPINTLIVGWKQPEQTPDSSCFDAHSRLPRVSPAAASSYLFQSLFLLLFLLMVVHRHLQKVLFTADEAHRASHPSKARAHTSKPIQRLPARLPSAAAQLLWLYSAQTGDKCAQPGWHHCAVSWALKGSCWGSFLRVSLRWGDFLCKHAAEDKQVACRQLHGDCCSLSHTPFKFVFSFGFVIGGSSCHSKRQGTDCLTAFTCANI